MTAYDVIVIGAGISGLSFAHCCGREGLSTLVIEKSDHIGGALHTYRIASVEEPDGFWIELGAHTCYNSYSNLIGIMEDCGILNEVISREKVPFKMLVDNRVKSIPSQLDILDLLFSAPRILTLRQEGQSIESYYSSITGKRNFERVIGPALNAVISQKANDFPADMLFKKRRRRKDVIKKFTLAQGLQTITDVIASQKNIEIVKDENVHKISCADGHFRIVSERAYYEAKSLALATPPSAAAQLLQGSFPDVSDKLSLIKVQAIESIGAIVSKDAVSISPVAGLIPSSDSFYSIVTRDTVRHDKYRGFTFHFKPDLTDMETKLKRITEVLGLQKRELLHVAERQNFIPLLKVGHKALAADIDQSLSGSSLFLTGNYFDGMAVEDCIVRSLKEFTRLKEQVKV